VVGASTPTPYAAHAAGIRLERLPRVRTCRVATLRGLSDPVPTWHRQVILAALLFVDGQSVG
jgi:hypothetical protein